MRCYVADKTDGHRKKSLHALSRKNGKSAQDAIWNNAIGGGVMVQVEQQL